MLVGGGNRLVALKTIPGCNSDSEKGWDKNEYLAEAKPPYST
jgi:hypothetical protein